MFIIFNMSILQSISNRIIGKLKYITISSTSIVFPEKIKEIVKNSIIIILKKLIISCKPTRINSKRDKLLPWNLQPSSRVKRKYTSFSLVKLKHILTNMIQWLYGKWIANQNYNDYVYRHLRDLASGTKKIIKSNAIKFIAIPHYDGLAVKHLLLFAKSYPVVLNHLPVEKEI